MTLPNRQLFWIANSTKRKARVLLIRASVARSAAGRPAKKTDGLVAAETNGTRSILEACVPRACISGLRLSAYLVAAGRRIRIGMRGNASGTVADAVPMPKLKPRAMRECIVVPSVRSSEVACAQRSRVGHREDALQPLDFSNALFSIHRLPSSSTRQERVKRKSHWSFLSDLCVSSQFASARPLSEPHDQREGVLSKV
jgi:hypothetical protein